MSVAEAALREQQARLLARAQQPPPDDWLPVVIGGASVGIADPDVAGFLANAEPRCFLRDYELVFDDDDLDVRARSALLQDAAARLRDAGLVRGWRDELLDVRAQPDTPPLATIERAACRALGIATTAVHLNALAADGRLWVARRAAHKQIDPGLWDNLVGGMVPAGESEFEALAREAQEEAGLDIAPLVVVRGGRVHVTRRVPEGFQSEIVQVFDAQLPADADPRNRDGEVERIAAREIADVFEAIGRDEFTLEAALVTLDGLLRQTLRPGATGVRAPRRGEA